MHGFSTIISFTILISKPINSLINSIANPIIDTINCIIILIVTVVSNHVIIFDVIIAINYGIAAITIIAESIIKIKPKKE